jgi:hypothetical protein
MYSRNKEPWATPQPRSYWSTCHSTCETVEPTCNQIRNKIIQMRQDIEHNPYKYPSYTPGGVQASASQPPDPHRKTSLICTLQVGWCLSLHPLGGAEHKTTSFPIHAGGVYTTCVHFFFSLSNLLESQVRNSNIS